MSLGGTPNLLKFYVCMSGYMCEMHLWMHKCTCVEIELWGRWSSVHWQKFSDSRAVILLIRIQQRDILRGSNVRTVHTFACSKILQQTMHQRWDSVKICVEMRPKQSSHAQVSLGCHWILPEMQELCLCDAMPWTRLWWCLPSHCMGLSVHLSFPV